MPLPKIPSMAAMMVGAALVAKVQGLTLGTRNCPDFSYLTAEGRCERKSFLI